MAIRKQPIVRRSLLWFSAVVVAIVGIMFALEMMARIPTGAITPTAMVETSVRIGLYFKNNRCLPPSLADLPVRDGYANRTTDAWNRSLHYTIDANDKFTLSSWGRDGQSGGSGEDADISQAYQVVDGQTQRVP